MPKRRPNGPPKRLRKTESTSKTNVLLGPVVSTLTPSVVTDIVEKVIDSKIGLGEMVGKENVAALVATNEGGATVVMTITVTKVEVELAERAAPQARPEIVGSTASVFRSKKLQLSAQI